MKKYSLTITDNDGESHEYLLRAQSPWSALLYVSERMTEEGDFYGHVITETMDIAINELVADATGHFITTEGNTSGSIAVA